MGDDDTFKQYFTQFGEITDAIVMKDRETGNTRGFGFVTFSDTAAVDAVMDMYKDHQISGKWVEVKRAVPKGDDKGGGKGGGKDKGGKGGDGGKAGNAMPPANYGAPPAYGAA